MPHCPALQDRRDALLAYWRALAHPRPALAALLEFCIQDEEKLLQLIVDCRALPEVTRAAEADQALLPLLDRITNIWAYSIFRTRLKLLGKWTA